MEKRADRPWFNWYDWHCEYWGTKWNAYDGYTMQGIDYVTLVFSTAWSYPDGIIRELINMGYELEYKYADEDFGHNCGIISSYIDDTGERIYNHEYDDMLTDATEFAESLWDKY